jgi:hypothetical protein
MVNLYRKMVEHRKRQGFAYVARLALWKLLRGSSYGRLSPCTYETLRLYLLLGYWPHIRQPRSLNEKIAHRELFSQHPLSHIVADKWRVREYVESKGLKRILNEIYFVTDAPDRIPFADLPDKFVIKPNHGFGCHTAVRDRGEADVDRIIAQCQEWLKLKVSSHSRTYVTHYDSIPSRIVVEKLIEDERFRVPMDYKFLCFHGRVRYLYVIDRSEPPSTCTFFDTEWKKQEISYDYPVAESVPRPARLAEMIEVSERLGAGFDFVRIDLYSPNDDAIVFGEMTLSPSAGSGVLRPRAWDFRLGELW